jgi:hypothetical protein
LRVPALAPGVGSSQIDHLIAAPEGSITAPIALIAVMNVAADAGVTRTSLAPFQNTALVLFADPTPRALRS